MGRFRQQPDQVIGVSHHDAGSLRICGKFLSTFKVAVKQTMEKTRHFTVVMGAVDLIRDAG